MTKTSRTGRPPKPHLTALVQVAKVDYPDLWITLTQEEGVDADNQARALMRNYYHRHWPKRRLRVVVYPGGRTIDGVNLGLVDRKDVFI